jgi:c-di-GMP-related signal transduction protein
MKIRMTEFKSRAIAGVEDLIDVYFSGDSISERLMNATVKIIVNQNVDKLDDVINLFADKNGFIDTDIMIREYGKAFGTDKVILDLRDFVNNDMVRRTLPNKAIAIHIEDLAKIFEDR